MKVKLETKVITGSSFALLLILYLVYQTYRNRTDYFEAYALISHTYKVENTIQKINGSLFLSEDAHHHYLNYQDENSLKYYQKTLDSLNKYIIDLASLTKNPEQLQFLSKLDAINKARIRLYDEELIAHNDSEDFKSLRKLLLKENAAFMTDSLKTILIKMGTYENSLLLNREMCYKSAISKTSLSFYSLVVATLISIVYFFFMILADIKTRRQSEKQLYDNERLLDAIFNESADALFIADKNTHEIVRCNKQAVSLFGMENEMEFIGKFGPELQKVKFNNADITKLNDEIDRKGYWESELEYLTKTGKEFWGSILVRPFIHYGIQFNLVRISNITDKKKAEIALRQYTEELRENKEKLQKLTTQVLKTNNDLKISQIELKELNAGKDKFFSILAHDLRSPFSGFIGISEYLTERAYSIERDEVEECASALHLSAKKIFGLLNNLLEWSRLQTGIMEFKPSDFNLYELVRDVAELQSISAGNKGISIINRVNKQTYIHADFNMVSTVFRNLISNAIKFTNSEGQIIIASEELEGHNKIKVIDSGIGMSEDVKNKIFRIDSNCTTRGTQGEEGSGLGLVLCKELVAKNHGEIWVNSEPGRGTEFVFTLPLAEIMDANEIWSN